MIKTDETLQHRIDRLIDGDFLTAFTGDVIWGKPIPHEALREMFTDRDWRIFITKTFRRWAKFAKTYEFKRLDKNDQMFLANTLIAALGEEP